MLFCGTHNGHAGAGGFVAYGTFSLTPGQSIAVTVGGGGSGALRQTSNTITGNSAGGSSNFGSLLTCNGGGTTTSTVGGAGGSGGGAGCKGTQISTLSLPEAHTII